MTSENKKPAIVKNQQLAEKIFSAGEAVQLERPSPQDIAFMSRFLIQANLPHSNPKRDIWQRKNGNLTLTIQAGVNLKSGTSLGLPYGVIPRLLFLWIVTEVIRTGERRIELGNSLSAFLRDIGLDPNTGGGKRSDAKRLRDQIERTLAAKYTFSQAQEQGDGLRWVSMELAPEAELWWDYKNHGQASIFESYIVLGERFYEAIKKSPVPLDLRAIMALTRSPLAMDFYQLMAYEAFMAQKHKKDHFIPWAGLMAQMGSEYADVSNFKKKAKAALRKVRLVSPWLHIADEAGGLRVLHTSAPPVPALPPVDNPVELKSYPR